MNIQEATQRISNMTLKKYGCRILFKRWNDEKHNYDDPVQRNLGANFIFSENNLLLPIYLSGEPFGVITIQGAGSLDALSLQNIQDFTESTLKELIIKQETLRRIKIAEASAEANLHNDNVIPFLRNDDRHKIKDFEDSSSKELELTHATIIDKDPWNAHKRAVNLHDDLNIKGFLPFLNIHIEEESFQKEILSLGRVTLFIQEVAMLSQKQQKLIEEFLTQFHSESPPLFIFATEHSMDTLRDKNLVRQALLEYMQYSILPE